MADSLIIRRAPGDRAREELAGDLERQIVSRLRGALPVVVKASQAAPSGPMRLLEVGQPGDSTEDIAMTTGGVYVIPHGLRRPAFGRLVVWQTAHATLRDVAPTTLDPSLDPSQFLALETSANCTWRLMVF